MYLVQRLRYDNYSYLCLQVYQYARPKKQKVIPPHMVAGIQAQLNVIGQSNSKSDSEFLLVLNPAFALIPNLQTIF